MAVGEMAFAGCFTHVGKKREQKVACEGSRILAVAARQLQEIKRHSSAAEAAAHASDWSRGGI
jgi:hypothetical protein